MPPSRTTGTNTMTEKTPRDLWRVGVPEAGGSGAFCLFLLGSSFSYRPLVVSDFWREIRNILRTQGQMDSLAGAHISVCLRFAPLKTLPNVRAIMHPKCAAGERIHTQTHTHALSHSQKQFKHADKRTHAYEKPWRHRWTQTYNRIHEYTYTWTCLWWKKNRCGVKSANR